MTIRSVGYDGSVGETDWSAYLAEGLGAPPGVQGPLDFRVTSTSGMQVQVAPGRAHGHGITDLSDAAEAIQIEASTSGTRYDAVVLRRDWAGTSTTPTGVAAGGRSYLTVVRGGSSQLIPAMQTSPGVIADQPLALVRVTAGQTTVTVTDDLRAHQSRAVYVRSMLAMNGTLGTQYTLESTGKRYVMVQGGSGVPVPQEEWNPAAPPPPTVPTVRSGTTTASFNNGAAVITHGLGFRPRVFLAASRASTGSAMLELYVSTQAGAVNETTATLVAKTATDAGWAPYTGGLSYVDWIAHA